MTTRRFEELDVLRGLAAVAVVLFHYSGHVTRYFGDFPFTLEIGKFGVQVFFTISGYVIYYTLHRCNSWKDFAFSRFSRLFPAYWATLALLLIADVAIRGKSPWWGGYLVNMTMLQTFVGFPDLDIVFWSLAAELVFYVAMGILFAAGLMHQIVVVAICWILCSGVWGFATRYAGWEPPDALRIGLILPHAPFFLSGIMFYLIHQKGYKAIYLSVILFAVVAAFLCGGIMLGLVATVSFAIFGLAVGGFLRWLVSPYTLWLGAISYPLYLLHRNLGYESLFTLNRIGVPSIVSVPIVAAGALAIASAVTYWIERPCMTYLRNWRKASLRPKR